MLMGWSVPHKYWMVPFKHNRRSMFPIGTNSFCNKRVWRQVDRQSSGRQKVTDDSKLYEWITRSHTLYDLLTATPPGNKLLITELTCSENTIHIVSRQGWSLQIDTLLKVWDKLLYSIRGNNAWLFDACNTICFKVISEKGCHDLLVYFWTFSTTFVYLPLSPRQQYLEGKGRLSNNLS